MPHHAAVLSRFLVDEVQDMTQATIRLLIKCCSDKNGLTLAGDTAQNICKGVSFRFEDLRVQFNSMQQQQLRDHKQRTTGSGSKGSNLHVNHNKLSHLVRVPDIHKLDFNFRSHQGILNMATSVVDLLYCYFRNSLDVLAPDQKNERVWMET